jgi:hypothetical protein
MYNLHLLRRWYCTFLHRAVEGENVGKFDVPIFWWRHCIVAIGLKCDSLLYERIYLKVSSLRYTLIPCVFCFLWPPSEFVIFQYTFQNTYCNIGLPFEAEFRLTYFLNTPCKVSRTISFSIFTSHILSLYLTCIYLLWTSYECLYSHFCEGLTLHGKLLSIQVPSFMYIFIHSVQNERIMCRWVCPCG